MKLRSILCRSIIYLTLFACRASAQFDLFSSLFPQTEVFPAGPLAHILAPATVRRAITTAVALTGVQPPFDSYIAKSVADRVIQVLNLEERRVTRPGLIGSMIQSVRRSTRVTAAQMVGSATETAVRSIVSIIAGQMIGDAVARSIGRHVVVALSPEKKNEFRN